MAKDYTTWEYIVEYAKVWFAHRCAEKSTIFGIITIVIALLNDPSVFRSGSALLNAYKHGDDSATIIALVVSFLLVCVRERHTMDEKHVATVNLMLKK
jgi:hypothetical protein